jgi:hypothetical protein
MDLLMIVDGGRKPFHALLMSKQWWGIGKKAVLPLSIIWSSRLVMPTDDKICPYSQEYFVSFFDD